MSGFWWAQLFSLVAAVMMVKSLSAEKEEALRLQSIDCIANVLADIILGGWTGVVLCLGSILRNNLGRLNLKVSKNFVAVISLVISGVVCLFTDGWIFLIACSALYTYAVIKDGLLRRDIALAVSLAGWFTYDFFIQSFPMAVADLIVLIVTVRKVNKEVTSGQSITVSVRDGGASKENATVSFVKDVISLFRGSKTVKEEVGSVLEPEPEAKPEQELRAEFESEWTEEKEKMSKKLS